VRLVLVDQSADRRVDLREPALGAELRGRLDHTAVEREQAPAAARDDAVARICQAGIYAEDDHGL